MCSCVSGEVLRQCSAANPADIYCCLYAYVYIILTPNEYYTVLPVLAINAASNKPGLAASALHTASFI